MKIVTVTCDIYADVAPAFVDLVRSKWPDCPHEIVFVTNFKKLNVSEKVYYINGKDDRFGWRMRQFISKHYTDEHLLFMMSDYLIKSVDTQLVARAHELCATEQIRHVRLRPFPHPQYDYPEPGFGRIDKVGRYSLSLQPGIWESQVLYDLCKDNENPWHTEIFGSTRVKNINGLFLSTTTAAISHINYYQKGKVSDKSKEWVKENVNQKYWPKEVK